MYIAFLTETRPPFHARRHVIETAASTQESLLQAVALVRSGEASKDLQQQIQHETLLTSIVQQQQQIQQHINQQQAVQLEHQQQILNQQQQAAAQAQAAAVAQQQQQLPLGIGLAAAQQQQQQQQLPTAQLQQQPGGAGGVQPPITTATAELPPEIAAMTDIDLISYINPSCFDQGKLTTVAADDNTWLMDFPNFLVNSLRRRRRAHGSKESTFY